MSVIDLDPIYETDGDELGGLLGWLLYGDVDLDDIELFMASEDVADHFPDGVAGGWEIFETYVRKVPRVFGYEYVYTSGPGRGARKATRIEQNHSWGYWCINHIWEPASIGIPVEQVADPLWPMVLARITAPERRREHARTPEDGPAYVYLCRTCATGFHERRALAEREARR